MPQAVSRSLFPTDLISEQFAGATWYVNPGTVTVARNGLAFDSGFLTVQAAVTAASAGDRIIIAPGTYVEAVTIALAKSPLALIGVGTKQSAAIAPSAANATALTNNADDVTLINLDLAGTGTGKALRNTGRRLNARGCKFEGDGTAAGQGALMTVCTVATHNITERNGSDFLFEDCEFAWADIGVTLSGTDFGAVTEGRFRRCVFHNLASGSIKEAVGSGGSAAVTYNSIEVTDCVFGTMEDGTVPNFVVLNANNANTGIVSGCRFPTAINGGKNLVSTKCLWIGNYHTGGIGAAQPS